MTTGVTYRNWQGRPALTQDGQPRSVAKSGDKWASVDFATVMREAASIGEGHFADMFAAWNLPDLTGWYQRRDPARPYDSYSKARRAAYR